MKKKRKTNPYLSAHSRTVITETLIPAVGVGCAVFLGAFAIRKLATLTGQPFLSLKNASDENATQKATEEFEFSPSAPSEPSFGKFAWVRDHESPHVTFNFLHA